MAALSPTVTTLSWVELAVRLLPPYRGTLENRIEPRRRIVQDLLEILACHQVLGGLPGLEPGWREIMEIAERWWVLWLAGNLAEEALSPGMPQSVVLAMRALADDIAAEVWLHGRGRVTAFLEWARERVPEYSAPFPWEDWR
jgi:hypothetical protein